MRSAWRLARRLGDALADHAPALDDHGPDHGVRAGLAPRASPASSMARWRCRASRSVAVISGIRSASGSSRLTRESTLPVARPARRPAGGRDLALRRRVHRLVLALILLAGFALRIWNIDYGLPFVYSIDEGSHFASRAVEMFWQDLDPGYYQNPAAFTYLLYAAPAGDVRPARLPLRSALRQRDRPVRQGPDRDLGRRPGGRRRAGHARGRRHLLGRAPAVGSARGTGGGSAAQLLVPSGGLLARGGDRRGRAHGRGAGAAVVGAGRGARADARLRARRGRGRPGHLLQVHGRPGAAAARDRGAGAAAPRRPTGPRRPGAGRRPGGARVRGAQSLPVRLARPVVDRPSRPGRRRGQRSQARAGVRRPVLLPGEPHLGARLGRPRGGAARRRARAAPRPGARADPDRAAACAARLPGHPVALFRALAAARLPGAGDAGRGRRGGRGRLAPGCARAPPRPALRASAARRSPEASCWQA